MQEITTRRMVIRWAPLGSIRTGENHVEIQEMARLEFASFTGGKTVVNWTRGLRIFF